MAAVDDVIAAAVLVIILTVGAMVYLMNSARDSRTAFEAKDMAFKSELHSNNLNQIMKVSEPLSKRDVGTLLADASYYRNTTPVINNHTIDVINVTTELLRMAYGNQEFYLEVKPRIIEVSLNFVIDGSQSLSEEREVLADELPNIITQVERKLNETNAGHNDKSTEVIATAYILANKNKELSICEPFTNHSDARIRCKIIDGSDIYLGNGTSNTSVVIINNTGFNREAFLTRYNMTPPFGVGWEENRSCVNCAHDFDYYTADYGYGVAYASYFDSQVNMAKLTLLFPMSDELSTSSIGSQCFGYTNYDNWITCSLCEDECPVARAQASVEKGVLVAEENNHVISPIFSFNCDYENDYVFGTGLTYATADANHGWNLLDTTSYAQSFGTNPSPTWCSLSACRGCTDNSGSICFHPECADTTLSQMQWMANSTEGSVISLQNLTEMNLDISSTINKTIDQFALRMGTMDLGKKRDVVEITQSLPNGQMVDVRFWVYR